jgi:hypothetical protein
MKRLNLKVEAIVVYFLPEFCEYEGQYRSKHLLAGGILRSNSTNYRYLNKNPEFCEHEGQERSKHLLIEVRCMSTNHHYQNNLNLEILKFDNCRLVVTVPPPKSSD